MQRLHELPDDVLILTFSYCNIDAVFAVQLICTSFSSLIPAYINTIAPKAAHATFPGCTQLLIAPEGGYSLKWLRGLITAQLASITLDQDKLRRCPYINSGYPYGIPSESDCEEAKLWRAKVVVGW